MIEISNISFAYGARAIFSDFTETLSSIGITLLEGPNGSGKTTLIQLIGGFLQPSQGQISIEGKQIANLSSSEQSRLRAVAPQRRIFDLTFTVSELLSIIPRSQRAEHSSTVMERLDIESIRERSITELSLGQQQRVSVALALIAEAPFYLLDEPLSAQDADHAAAALELFAILARNHGLLLVAHGLESRKLAGLGRVLSIRTDVR